MYTVRRQVGTDSCAGVIKLTRQQRPAAQEQALMIRGYDEDHVSILNSESVIRKLHDILHETSK